MCEAVEKVTVSAASIWRSVAILSLLGLSACAAGGFATKATLALVSASGASLMHTDRTLSDHAISRYTKQDCALLHVEAGEAYCQDDPRATPGPAAAHCYRSLAAVTCYVEANPEETISRQMPALR